MSQNADVRTDGGPTAAAVVPAHNEQGRVGSVVRSLVGSGRFLEVVVVSDGSDDLTAAEAESAGAKVIVLPDNQGKAEAMSCGLRNVSSPVVCFFDADLKGLKARHIDLLLDPVLRGEVDMAVGLCDRTSLTNWLIRRLPLLSGQRALRREIFESVPKPFMSGYGVELALDRYCRTNGLRVGVAVLEGLGFVRKIEKIGFLLGLFQYVRMVVQLVVWYIWVRLDSFLGRLTKKTL